MIGNEKTPSDLSDESNDKSTVNPEDLKVSRYSSIAMINYFNAIEQICEEKGINPANVEQFFKVHWLRDRVGGSFARSQEMLGVFKDYINNVPEEARDLDVPEPVKIALCDMTSFITWFFRMSYTKIQSESVKKAKAISSQLQQEVTRLLEQLAQSTDKVADLTQENLNLNTQLKQQQELSSKLGTSLSAAEAELASRQSELDHANNEIRLSQQTVGTLNQQLVERKQELANQYEYQKQLIEENKKQQAEITGITSQCEHLKQTVSDLTSSSRKLEQDLSESNKFTSELQLTLADSEATQTTLRAELSKSEDTNVQLRAEVQRLEIENQNIATERKDQSTELQKLTNQIVSMEATLKAEKTIADSLRGTIESLTAAMTGNVSTKPNPPRVSKNPQKKKTT
ncbi:hypothetical protein QPK13_23115 [Photorhabdus tasmaniensis]